jgi:hypothetical protein
MTGRPFRLAVGIITWEDGEAMLQQTIASLQGIADELLIADGAITGINLQGLPVTSAWVPAGADRAEPSWLPADTHVSSHEWPSQSVKRTWLLDKARQLGCDWLLQIDADERLHGAAKLREWLPSWGYDAFPLPFQVEPDQLLCATWKCLRVGAWARVVAGGAYIEHADGNVYCVVPPDGRPPAAAASFLPWISHHPDERPEGRRMIRLGELEEALEPPPPALEWVSAGLDPAPLIASALVEPDPNGFWYCDQCGRRYSGPGVCSEEHPPAEVQKVDAVSTQPDGDSGEPVPAEAGPQPGEVSTPARGDRGVVVAWPYPPPVSSTGPSHPLDGLVDRLHDAARGLREAADTIDAYLSAR